MGRILIWTALLMLSGCTATSQSVSIAEALAALQAQLQAAGAINPAGVSGTRFALAVHEAQCQARSGDPEVPILSREITIDLTGSFTANGGFAVGPPSTGGAPFGFSGALTRSQSQGLTLPVTFAALSAVPDVMAAQRINLFTDLPAASRIVETHRVLVERDALRLRIQALILGFSPGRCRSERLAS